MLSATAARPFLGDLDRRRYSRGSTDVVSDAVCKSPELLELLFVVMSTDIRNEWILPTFKNQISMTSLLTVSCLA